MKKKSRNKNSKVPTNNSLPLFELSVDDLSKIVDMAKSSDKTNEFLVKACRLINAFDEAHKDFKPNESTMKSENIVQDAVSKLCKLTAAYDKASTRPDLDEEQMYEYAFKDVMDKKQYQEIINDIKQEMLKSGYYRRNDSKNRQ
jgi:hypothetical protein